MNETDEDVVVVDTAGDSSIPAGYFLKPDPVLTRVETRHYLMGELARYLKGSLLTDAVAALEVVPVGPVAGPVGRMVYLYRLLKGDGKLPEGTVGEQMAHVGRWIFSVIQASLTVGLPSVPTAVTEYETLALAFWNEDLLPGGRTIGSYWDYSPFEALRTAPPLTTTEDVTALPPSPPSAEPEDDMPGLISLDQAGLAADTGGPDDDEDYSDMPPLIPIDELYRGKAPEDTIQQVPAEDVGNEDEGEEEYVAYSNGPQLPKSLEDCIGGAVESLMNFALRPVTIPVWGIALALAILPPLLMSKC